MTGRHGGAALICHVVAGGWQEVVNAQVVDTVLHTWTVREWARL